MKYILALFALLFSGMVYSQITFEENIIYTEDYGTSQARSVYSADFDGDGDVDVITASDGDGNVNYYENTDGLGRFVYKQSLSTTSIGVRFVFASDIDGDGDLDALSASYNDNTIAWYENINGQGDFGSQQIISSSSMGAESLHTNDLDGDNDIDVIVVSSEDDTLAWYENLDGQGNFGPIQIITSASDEANTVFSADIDGDGDIDIVSGALSAPLFWYANTDGLGNFVVQQEISGYGTSIHVADINGDTNIDVIYSIGSSIYWSENTDGLGTFSTQQSIASIGSTVKDVYAEDIDGDGDMDVLSASATANDRVLWFENEDGQGNFGPIQVITNKVRDPYSVHASDIDNDGDIDVLAASIYDDRITFYENEDGLGDFGDLQEVSNTMKTPTLRATADIDGDGDMDLLVTTDYILRKLVWYENYDGLGDFGTHKIIISERTDNFRAGPTFPADLDGDGDLDLVVSSTSPVPDELVWFENINGHGDFGPKQIISTDISFPRSVYAVDLDSDGDMDVLSASYSDDKIAWYENTDGSGTLGIQQVITINANGASQVSAADLDGDNNKDVISYSDIDNRISWHRNTNGEGDFGTTRIISVNEGYDRYETADLDGDGDIDLVSHNDNNIAWFENVDGLGNFELRIVQVNPIYSRTGVADIDNDGDIDIYSSNSINAYWHENLDGLGTFGTQQDMGIDLSGIRSMIVADLNGDGNVDPIVAVNGQDESILWYSNSGNLSISENDFLDFTIHPNPVDHLLNVSSEMPIESIKIFNSIGQLVLFNKDENEIIVSKLTTGIYFVKVKNIDGSVGVQKLLKK